MNKGYETGPFKIMKKGIWFYMLVVYGEVVYKKVLPQPKIEWIE